MININWKFFKFIARKDTWYVEGSEAECLFDYGNPRLNDVVEKNVGLFQGMTEESYTDYKGELPRLDEEGCLFDEFDIYYKNELINNITYDELIKKLNE